MASYRVPARTGLAVDVDAGQRVAVVDVEGGQVGDFFAFNRDDLSEHLSASHTRAFTSRLLPGIGECFVSSRRRPMLRVVADTSPGYHDMLIAACDEARYAQLGFEDGHASCAENLATALAATGRTVSHVPQPFNVFMRTPAGPDGTIAWLPAESAVGDRYEMEALIDLVVVLSACPSDTVGINVGGPTALAIELTG
ncbi:MAG TPA: urea carboxylase-associated family protein [Acidimicrobiales bacterium]|jgi:hypothetical protein